MALGSGGKWKQRHQDLRDCSSGKKCATPIFWKGTGPRGTAAFDFCKCCVSGRVAMGQKPNPVPPVNIPIPTKIGWVVNSPTPKWDPIGFDPQPRSLGLCSFRRLSAIIELHAEASRVQRAPVRRLNGARVKTPLTDPMSAAGGFMGCEDSLNRTSVNQPGGLLIRVPIQRRAWLSALRNPKTRSVAKEPRAPRDIARPKWAWELWAAPNMVPK